jgi:DNA-binding transcriptional MerR regulator
VWRLSAITRNGVCCLSCHSSGSYRQYPVAIINRIRFIKRSQELGFSLDEISELLRLDEKIDKRTIRSLANQKIEQIQQKLDDLQQMQTTLQQLVDITAATVLPESAARSLRHCPETRKAHTD